MEKPIAFYPQIARELGDIASAIYYQQLYYWSDKGKRDDGWIYKSVKEIEEETTLSRFQQDRSRKLLIKKGYLEAKKKMANGAPTYHYRCLVMINVIITKGKFRSVRNSQNEVRETRKSEVRETRNSITENTREYNTSKKTSFLEDSSSDSPEYIPCYDDGFTKQERQDFFKNRRRKAADVAKDLALTPADFLDKMSKTKDYPSKIIYLYIKHKKLSFENIDQLINEFNRNLKTAHKLKCYKEARLTDTFSILDSKDYEWTLETVLNKINEYQTKSSFSA